MAISGVARAFQRQLRSEGLSAYDCAYFAGLWRKDLKSQLLWYATQPVGKCPDLRSPSWLWASVNGQIIHSVMLGRSDLIKSFHAQLLDIKVHLCSSDTFGEVDGGWLKLNCDRLFGVVIEGITELGLRWLHREERSRQRMYLDSSSTTPGPAVAPPVLTGKDGEESGLLLSSLSTSGDSVTFKRIGIYTVYPKAGKEVQTKLGILEDDKIVITIV